MGLKNTWFNRTFRPKRLGMEKDISDQTSNIRSMVGDIPRYEIPEEALQMMKMYEESAQGLGEATALGEEAVDVARSRTGVAEAPGAGLAREDIRQSTAQSVQSLLEAGGGSASTLGAIQQVGAGEQAAMTNLAAQTQQYRSQAEMDLQNALRSQAGLTANITQAQAGMRAQGLGTMLQQKGYQQESDLNKYLTGLQFETGMLGNQQAELQNMMNRRAQLWGSAIGAVGSIAGAGLTGGFSGMFGGGGGSGVA